MLVRLYDLPDISDLLDAVELRGISIRRALVPEKRIVVSWVERTFHHGWADETASAFSGHPVRCFIATEGDRVVGMSVYNAISPGVAGPLGIDPGCRSGGVGKALFIRTLHDMRQQGYAYAILGWIPPEAQAFYAKIVNATVIEGTQPASGMYRGIITRVERAASSAREVLS